MRVNYGVIFFFAVRLTNHLLFLIDPSNQFTNDWSKTQIVLTKNGQTLISLKTLFFLKFLCALHFPDQLIKIVALSLSHCLENTLGTFSWWEIIFLRNQNRQYTQSWYGSSKPMIKIIDLIRYNKWNTFYSRSISFIIWGNQTWSRLIKHLQCFMHAGRVTLLLITVWGRTQTDPCIVRKM